MTKVAILGGYGLIGSACLRALKTSGFDVTGIGRSRRAGLRCDPSVPWIEIDMAKATAGDWLEVFADVDVVVNAAGALQDGARDNLRAIHESAIGAMTEALRGRAVRFIQISAVGVSETAATEFLRSKARGDARIARSGLDSVILRPSLVVSADAYGGTALLRAAAALPFVGLRLLGDSQLQTVCVADVADAVVEAASGRVPTGTVADLTESRARSFHETLALVRAWQGFPPWRLTVTLPYPALRICAVVADLLGWLGWRSPVRSTAIRTLETGVTGDPDPWRAVGGKPMRSLEETLASLPSTAQDRLFARLYLLMPLVVAALSALWIASGLIGFAQRAPAGALLTGRGVAPGPASLIVLGGAGLDCMVGLALLWRPWARRAALASSGIALGYMAGACILAADLWLDPLGPMVKVIAVVALGLVAAALLEDR